MPLSATIEEETLRWEQLLWGDVVRMLKVTISFHNHTVTVGAFMNTEYNYLILLFYNSTIFLQIYVV